MYYDGELTSRNLLGFEVLLSTALDYFSTSLQEG